mmetsp:Transcript_10405/g.32923  ORF Transcript_10405/g.32923 Transcript_10405/m.32923 type:complete len:131 (-) Transcript_10405:62-454(-)
MLPDLTGGGAFSAGLGGAPVGAIGQQSAAQQLAVHLVAQAEAEAAKAQAAQGTPHLGMSMLSAASNGQFASPALHMSGQPAAALPGEPPATAGIGSDWLTANGTSEDRLAAQTLVLSASSGNIKALAEAE